MPKLIPLIDKSEPYLLVNTNLAVCAGCNRVAQLRPKVIRTWFAVPTKSDMYYTVCSKECYVLLLFRAAHNPAYLLDD